MLIRTLPLLLRWLLLGCVTLGVLALPRTFLSWHYQSRIHALDSLPELDPDAVALVFGAGLRRNGTPTRVLEDRIAAAVYLYRRGAVQSLVLSGTSRAGYDEPGAMQRYARALGVPDADLQLDRSGTRTIETCRRAKAAGFQSVLLVTQRYHLPRALATCDGLGLSAQGVSADLRSYRGEFVWTLREIPATLVALYEAYLQPGETTAGQALRSLLINRYGS